MKKIFSLFIAVSFMFTTLTANAGCEAPYIAEISRIHRSLDAWYGGFGFNNYYRPHYYQPTVVIHVDTSHNHSNRNTSAAEAIILLALVAIPTTHIIIMADRMDGIDDILGLIKNSRDFLAPNSGGFVGNELTRMTRRIFGKELLDPEHFKMVAETVLKLDNENKFCNGEIAQDLEMRTVISGISSRHRLLARYIEVKRAVEREIKLQQPVF